MHEPYTRETSRPMPSFSDDELLAELHARTFELHLIRERLSSNAKRLVLTLIAFYASLLLVGASLVVAFVPTVTVSTVLSTLSAFLSVLFGGLSYVTYRRAAAEAEKTRLLNSIARRVTALERAAAEIDLEAKSNRIRVGASHDK